MEGIGTMRLDGQVGIGIIIELLGHLFPVPGQNQAVYGDIF